MATEVSATSPDNKELEEAELNMVTASFMVDRLQTELDNARAFQREARDKYIALCGKAVESFLDGAE